jgi:hypothetical protein
MRGTKLYAMFAAMFMAGAFLASPELRVYAANTVGSADIINNSIQSVDIKDGEVKTDDIAPGAIGSLRIKDNDVKAQDLAPDSVGGSELQGVTKLLFGQCNTSDVVGLPALDGGFIVTRCSISGADTDDSVIATLNGGTSDFCFDAGRAYVESNNVVVVLIRDYCETTEPIKYLTNKPLSVVVFDK